MPLPKTVKAVLFDFDHTLIHLGADWEKLRMDVKKIAESFGQQMDERWVLRGIGLAFKKLTDDGRESDAAKFRAQAFACVEAEENRALSNSHAIARAPEVVGELIQRGYRVAIVSNNNPGSIRKGLEMFQFPAVELIIGRNNGDPVKPSPIPLHKAMTKLGVKAAEAVMIGDGEADLAASKAAGVASIHFAPQGAKDGVVTKPTATIEDLGKLLEMFPPLNGHAGESASTGTAAT